VVVDTNRLLRQLAQARIGVAIDHFSQTSASLKVSPQGCSRHAKGPTRRLDAAMKSRALNVKYRRGMKHAFAANLSNRHVSSAWDRQDNRDETLHGKPHVP
jgi:hypothetical protein